MTTNIGCAASSMPAKWEPKEVRLGAMVVRFELPNNQSTDMPRSSPVSFLPLVDEELAEKYQRIFDGQWDFRRSPFRAPEGNLEVKMTLVGLDTPAPIHNLDAYFQSMFERDVKIARDFNARADSKSPYGPRRPVPTLSSYEFVETSVSGRASLIEKRSNQTIVAVPLTQYAYLMVYTNFPRMHQTPKIEESARATANRIIESLEVEDTR